VQGASYHIRQAMIGIGSGGIFGVGFGASQQKHAFLPEVVGDSIFAVLVEELGLLGGMFLIALFLALLLVLISIANRSRDDFGRFFVLGVGVWVVVQAFINIAAISGIVPLTGLPLPFLSFGSSSLVSVLAAMGIVLSVARYS
jgi:cell division protein FtsW